MGALGDGASRSALRSFAAVERFLAEVHAGQGAAAGKDQIAMRAGYVLLGDDSFLLEMCLRGVVEALAPREMREFCLHDLDLAQTTVFEALDLAQTPSLMAPFQVLFLRNVKTLYGRGQKKEEFAAIDAYFRRPNPRALVIFVADHIALPQDLRRMEMTDKEKAEKIRETLGDVCGVVELQQVSDEDAVRWVMRQAKSEGVIFQEDAARELVDALGASGGAEMMLLASELEKLLLYATAPAGASQSAGQASEQAVVSLADVERMVSSARQRSLYELTDAISQKDASRALALLGGLLNASEGGEDAAIGHVFALARIFRQMLVLNEKQVKDQRAMWQVLWPGFRVAPFGADALIAQARRYRDRAELKKGLRLIARADLELRSSPADKRLVLERLVLRLVGRTGEMETGLVA
ncbi:MAG: DNA polymerase III subunit delta [Acidobacteriaceae bacterium]